MKKIEVGSSKAKGDLGESEIKQGFKKLGKIDIHRPKKDRNWGTDHHIPGVNVEEA